jgi:carbon monoxide dehydrogenase subunit G
MEMTGEFHIPARRERVWQALNDPEVLKQAIPGCQTIEKVSDTEFAARVRAKVGPVSATFGGKVNLSDLDPPKAYTISGEGSGGVAGFAKGSAKVKLDEEGDKATRLRYEVQAHVGGKLAQIGSRLIDATSRKMADDFFSRFVEAVSPAAENAADTALAAAHADAPAPGEAGNDADTSSIGAKAAGAQAVEPNPSDEPSSLRSETVSGRLRPAVWVTALTATVAAVLYFFTRKDGAR